MNATALKVRRSAIVHVASSDRSRYTKALGKARRRADRELRSAGEPERGDDDTIEQVTSDPLLDVLPDLG